jgi:hypothetical protein
VTLLTAVGCGAVGGLIAEAIAAWQRLHAWQQARHAAMKHGKPRPAAKDFMDPLTDPLAACARALLGALAGLMLHDEVTGIYAALTVGASAPALLANLGKAATPADAIRSGGEGQGREAVRSPLPSNVTEMSE